MPPKLLFAATVALSLAAVATAFVLRSSTNGGGATPATEASPLDAPAAAPATAPEAPGSPSPTTPDEPTREDCVAAVEQVQTLANALPADHPSRYIAERHLHQSMAEAGNGEFDDCLYWAERAMLEVRELRHEPKPGEKIEVLQPDETPTKTEPAGKTNKKGAHEKARH